MDLVVIGRIGGPHGISGALRVTSSTQPPGNIERYQPWLVGRDGDYRPIEVIWLKPHGQGYVARFAGVSDREAARALSGLQVAVPRQALPALEAGGEYYWQDLIGLTVELVDGTRLGTVTRLLETGAHDVLIIAGGGREILVPFVDPIVVDVDLGAGRIVVDWQEPG